VHLDEHRRLPTFETHEAKVETVLSDNGREFCGRPDQHRYELFLQLEEIEHPRRAHQARQPPASRLDELMPRAWSAANPIAAPEQVAA